MKTYQQTIKNFLDNIGLDADPRHIEGYMRLQHSTLDGLSFKQFCNEIMIGYECIKVDGKENAEKLAQSYAL